MPKILLAVRYHIIEPLGAIYLAGLARDIGYEVEVCQVKDNDFKPLYERVAAWKPDFVGFSIWTGYHLQAFAACDWVREMGHRVIIGGPHATYFSDECAKHADYVAKGEAFRLFKKILQGQLSPGVHFDSERMGEGFPMPNRRVVYKDSAVHRDSPIKSMFCSIGCPFHCSYCYAPAWNKMYDGFKLTLRPIDELIAEGKEIRDSWPTSLIYFQDDIFGFNVKWLKEFVRRWKDEVGIPWHCQVRLELVEGNKGSERLDLFAQGGCTGITLAIESGNAFLREFVLCRPMEHELIVEGCRKILDRGMTLRTEQILAVPFSDIQTDLATLKLNCEIDPEMAWTSILSPYQGTAMGTITRNHRLYLGDNDDLDDNFFDKSVLRHVASREDLVQVVSAKKGGVMQNPLLSMVAVDDGAGNAHVFFQATEGKLEDEKSLCTFRYMNDVENERYCSQTVILQRLFNWLSHVPEGYLLGEDIVNLHTGEWTWLKIGELTHIHLVRQGYEEDANKWVAQLAKEMGYGTSDNLPEVVRQNPYYFIFFSGSAAFAKKAAEELNSSIGEHDFLDRLWTMARHWLFMKSLYKIDAATPAIASKKNIRATQVREVAI